MGFSNWLDRNGTKLVLTMAAAVIAGFFAMVSLFISELGQANRASIVQIREDMRLMRTEMRGEMRNIRIVIDRVETKVNRLETKVNRLETKINRVETKVDELAVLFKYHEVLRHEDSQSETAEP